MNNLGKVFNYTLKKHLSSGAFIISTFAICVLVILIYAVISTSSEEPQKINIEVADKTGYFSELGNLCSNVIKDGKITMINDPGDESSIKKKVAKNDNLVIIVFNENQSDKNGLDFTAYDNNIIGTNDLTVIQNVADRIYKYAYGSKLGLTNEELSNICTGVSYKVVQLDTTLTDTYIIVYVLLMILAISIMMYGSQVAGEITYAKTNRVMENLVTSTTPKSLLVGTTFAIGTVGLIQFVTIFLVSAGGYFLFRPKVISLDGLNIDFALVTIDKIIVFILLFLLSYFLYAFLNAGFGSLVNKSEDAYVVILPVAILSMVQLFTGFYVLFGARTGFLYQFLSYLPFTAAGTMMTRYFTGNATIFEVVICSLDLLLTIIMIAAISVKIFKFGVHFYGSLSLKKSRKSNKICGRKL